MFTRVKEGCKKYGTYIALGLGATVASLARLVCSMGEMEFRAEAMAKNVIGTSDEHNPLVIYTTYAAIAFSGAMLLLTVIPTTFRQTFTKEKKQNSASGG